MRYRPEHKAEVHQKIVKDASRRVRAEGLTGAAVAAVMRDTGLTHGGFYKHFGSKDELLLESLREAFREIADKLARARGAGATRGGVEGDCEVLSKPGILRSRRARLPADGACAGMARADKGMKAQIFAELGELQEPNASVHARSASCGQGARILFDFFNHDRGS